VTQRSVGQPRPGGDDLSTRRTKSSSTSRSRRSNGTSVRARAGHSARKSTRNTSGIHGAPVSTLDNYSTSSRAATPLAVGKLLNSDALVVQRRRCGTLSRLYTCASAPRPITPYVPCSRPIPQLEAMSERRTRADRPLGAFNLTANDDRHSERSVDRYRTIAGRRRTTHAASCMHSHAVLQSIQRRT